MTIKKKSKKYVYFLIIAENSSFPDYNNGATLRENRL